MRSTLISTLVLGLHLWQSSSQCEAEKSHQSPKQPQSSSSHPRPWLDGTKTPLPLLYKKKISPDTKLYRFGLPPFFYLPKRIRKEHHKELKELGFDDDSRYTDGKEVYNTSGHQVCSCLLVSPSTNSSLVRPYTPISKPTKSGSIDLLVKHYTNGAMSREFSKLKIGDKMVFWQIPFNIKERYPFEGDETIVMLAVGTGITPMFQAIQRLFDTDEDQSPNLNTHTKVILLYGCRSRNDILLQKELERVQQKYPDRFQLSYIISQDKKVKDTDDGRWTQGRISKDMLERLISDYIPALYRGEEKCKVCKVWICGTPSFYDDICGSRGEEDVDGILKEFGFESDQVVKF